MMRARGFAQLAAKRDGGRDDDAAAAAAASSSLSPWHVVRDQHHWRVCDAERRELRVANVGGHLWGEQRSASVFVR
eukprot:CAMPEP_0198335450 /NCGR_PEP_ID=MMETSP1450-20131203/20324_1 /TAXON_ID=753684 ORGANISM="Madagascaria erythrocladiodes, Strain CCMP3234" /NCGR_SAMPLE_ID=MMETSP1450 /ASSEMBLY_ACC=CAM_ASM_001115 /LENGTH=75 /DNA_ID=CAMNT_0044040111 /DNA_START=1 /DNA_END=225 /DNA_ORIENTATION=+